ncbi:helix-turn-helix domain-containing protein [Hoeflea sp.]|uniref:helix-turn-helix domain-containing protein n=1 Tax=Hoeflea sp. TaxID=1940281 RepID=UPI003B018719
MRNSTDPTETLNKDIADRLKALRQEHGWSLEELSDRCGVSRATLSRLENAEVSPTAHVLGKLCSAFGLTMSRLMSMVEAGFEPLVTRENQPYWEDQKAGLKRTNVSPPSQDLTLELIECRLAAGSLIDYPDPPNRDVEHHLYMLEGRLMLIVDGDAFQLRQGDCLRYRLKGRSTFRTDETGPARYILAIA